jgi:hypothetical protein
MQIPDEKYGIVLDLDYRRIKDIIAEAYDICKTTLGAEFNISQEAFVKKIDPYLGGNRITIPVSLELPSRKCADLRIEVDFRKKSVFARTCLKPKQVLLNRYLGSL